MPESITGSSNQTNNPPGGFSQFASGSKQQTGFTNFTNPGSNQNTFFNNINQNQNLNLNQQSNPQPQMFSQNFSQGGQGQGVQLSQQSTFSFGGPQMGGGFQPNNSGITNTPNNNMNMVPGGKKKTVQDDYDCF
jgi:hypothetical protein